MAPSSDPLTVQFWAFACIGVLPVLAFLAALLALDSYKLVRGRAVATALTAGAAAAAASLWIHGLTNIPTPMAVHYAAPVVEETAKAAFVVFLIRSHRVGFLVDGAILGFAIGSGFAAFENLFYLHTRPDAGLLVWLIRGFGTAVMHGGSTAVFAILAKVVWDRYRTLPAFLPGWIAAAAIHAAFNHFVLPPIPMAAVTFVALTGLLLAAFHRSERATRRWLGRGFDADQRLLEQLSLRHLEDDRIGRYLQELAARFPRDVVADMLCLLRLRAELSVKAKGMLLMRRAGFNPEPPRDLKATLDEIDHLRTRIGPTGLLALGPVLRPEHRELWEHQLLGVR